jgi:hypothetical protein
MYGYVDNCLVDLAGYFIMITRMDSGNLQKPVSGSFFLADHQLQCIFTAAADNVTSHSAVMDAKY